MRNAGDRGAHAGRPPGTPRDAGAGGRVSGSSRPRDTEEQAPPPGGASLFTPAYRVSHADAGGQPGTGSAGPAGYSDAGFGHAGGDDQGSGYTWTDGEPQARGGYDRTGHGSAGYGSADHGSADHGSTDHGTADHGRADHDGAGYGRADVHRAGYGAAADGPQWPDDELGSPYSWSTGDPSAWPGTSLPDAGAQHLMSNAVRGLPPAPGDSLPVYPPGPFAAWNRGQPGRQDGRDGRAGRAGGLADGSQLATATITPDEFDTDYSIPAIRDPSPGQADRSAGSRASARCRGHRRRAGAEGARRSARAGRRPCLARQQGEGQERTAAGQRQEESAAGLARDRGCVRDHRGSGRHPRGHDPARDHAAPASQAEQHPDAGELVAGFAVRAVGLHRQQGDRPGAVDRG